MFPLAAVVFPHTELPLHVFELRYQELTRDALLGSKEFGICLISRGSEVGGGDERVSIGTRVRIELAAPLDGDRWLLVTKGIERIEILEWLPEAPYPRALVESLPADDAEIGHEAVLRALGAVKSLRRLQSEFSDGWTSTCVDLGLDEDPAAASWMLCAMSPLSLCDLQSLLETPDHPSRLAALAELCDARRADLEAMLRLEGTP